MEQPKHNFVDCGYPHPLSLSLSSPFSLLLSFVINDIAVIIIIIIII